MSALGNSNINRIFLHSALVFMAETAAGGFVFAYLLKSGLPLHWVFLSMTLICALRYVLRLLVLGSVLRFGLRTCIFFALAVMAASYVMLSQVNGLTPPFFIWIVLNALAGAFYWPCYHAAVALLGDAEKRGAQMSVKEAINTVAGIIGPAIAGALLTFTTPLFAFGVFAVILALSAVPLFGVDTIEIAPNAVLDAKQAIAGRNFFITDGTIAGTSYIWLAAIFITLNQSYLNLGGVLTVASLVGAIATLFIGRMMDKQHAKPTLFWVYVAMGFVFLLNSFAYSTFTGVLAASIVYAIIGPIHYPVMMTPIYNLAKTTACPLRFHIKTDSGWDIGCALTCAIAAATSDAGLSLMWPLLLGVVGCVAGYLILTRDQAFKTRSHPFSQI